MMMKNQGKIYFYFKNFSIIFFEFSSSKFSKERLAQFRNLSERPDIYELLSNAIGNDFIKKLNSLIFFFVYSSKYFRT